jgi:hypothetical protein
MALVRCNWIFQSSRISNLQIKIIHKNLVGGFSRFQRFVERAERTSGNEIEKKTHICGFPSDLSIKTFFLIENFFLKSSQNWSWKIPPFPKKMENAQSAGRGWGCFYSSLSNDALTVAWCRNKIAEMWNYSFNAALLFLIHSVVFASSPVHITRYV